MEMQTPKEKALQIFNQHLNIINSLMTENNNTQSDVIQKQAWLAARLTVDHLRNEDQLPFWKRVEQELIELRKTIFIQ